MFLVVWHVPRVDIRIYVPRSCGRLVLDGVVNSNDYNASLGNGSINDAEKAMKFSVLSVLIPVQNLVHWLLRIPRPWTWKIACKKSSGSYTTIPSLCLPTWGQKSSRIPTSRAYFSVPYTHPKGLSLRLRRSYRLSNQKRRCITTACARISGLARISLSNRRPNPQYRRSRILIING
jgi:hypothetical protein